MKKKTPDKTLVGTRFHLERMPGNYAFTLDIEGNEIKPREFIVKYCKLKYRMNVKIRRVEAIYARKAYDHIHKTYKRAYSYEIVR